MADNFTTTVINPICEIIRTSKFFGDTVRVVFYREESTPEKSIKIFLIEKDGCTESLQVPLIQAITSKGLLKYVGTILAGKQSDYNKANLDADNAIEDGTVYVLENNRTLKEVAYDALTQFAGLGLAVSEETVTIAQQTIIKVEKALLIDIGKVDDTSLIGQTDIIQLTNLTKSMVGLTDEQVAVIEGFVKTRATVKSVYSLYGKVGEAFMLLTQDAVKVCQDLYNVHYAAGEVLEKYTEEEENLAG